jgi:hypothetical protein
MSIIAIIDDEEVAVKILDPAILPEQLGQTSTSRRYARFMSVAQLRRRARIGQGGRDSSERRVFSATQRQTSRRNDRENGGGVGFAAR